MYHNGQAKENIKKIIIIFFFAYVLRLVLAFVFYKADIAAGGMGFFLGMDDSSSGLVSLDIANNWRGAGFFLMPGHFNLSSENPVVIFFCDRMTYEILTAFILYISKNSVLSVLFMNCFLGALSTVVLYRISRCFFNEKVSLLSAGFFAVWPSLIFWSVINLREAVVTFLLLVSVLYAVSALRKVIFSRGAIKNYLLCLFFTALLYLFLKPIAYLVIFTALIASAAGILKNIFRKGKPIFRITFALVILCTAITTAVFFYDKAVKKHVESFVVSEIGDLGRVLSNPVGAVEMSRQARIVYQPGKVQLVEGQTTRGQSVILPGLHITSYKDLLTFLPLSLAIGIFYPLPWQANSLMALVAVPEMIAWYVLFPFFLRGIFLSLKRSGRDFAAILFMALILFLFFIILPMHDGNAGALFRHRGMIMPLVFIFISSGLLSGWGRKSKG